MPLNQQHVTKPGYVGAEAQLESEKQEEAPRRLLLHEHLFDLATWHALVGSWLKAVRWEQDPSEPLLPEVAAC